MEHKSMKRMRLLPLCAVAFMAAASVSMLLSGNSSGLNAAVNAPARTGENGFPGREYVVDGIHYYIPFGEDTSRDAAVVSFPNHAVIPSYITVKGIKYTVREIRQGAAQTDIDDPDGWVTLPPTLKRAVLSDYYLHQHIDFTKTAYTYGVQNVVISDLDSFLNMERFDQSYEVFANEFKPGGLKGNWKLYLNGVELKDYDYIYPEGSPMGTSLNGLLGVKSITVPASDTARTTPLYCADLYMLNTNREAIPKRLQFKADKGYNLGYYYISADTLVMPRGMTDFKGYGNLCNDSFFDHIPFKGVIWSDSLKIITSSEGLGPQSIKMRDFPPTLMHLGLCETAYNTTRLEVVVGDTLTIPQNMEKIGNIDFSYVTEGGLLTEFCIEDSDKPLAVSGIIKLPDAACFPTFYIGRNIVQKNQISNFKAVVKNNKSATIIFGANVTELPKWGPVRLRDAADNPVSPLRIICKGLTPPDFSTSDPYILRWKDETELFVPEAAVEAYRSHPVWGQFRTIQTTAADQIQMEREVVSERWISLDGRMLSVPETGRVNIQVTTYSDGTTDTRKVAVPEK